MRSNDAKRSRNLVAALTAFSLLVIAVLALGQESNAGAAQTPGSLPNTWPPGNALFWDDFNSGLKPAWLTAGGNWTVVSGAYEQTTLGVQTYSWPQGVICGDCEVQAALSLPSSGGGSGERSIGVVLRMQDTNNLYLADFHLNQEVRMWRRVNGTWTQLASSPYTVAYDTSYDFRFTAYGSTLRVYVNGTQILTATDNTFIHGLAGLRVSEAHARYDNFAISGQAASTPTPTPTVQLDQLFYDGFGSSLSSEWETTGEWFVESGVLRQTLLGYWTNVTAWPRTIYCTTCVVTARAQLDGRGGVGLISRVRDTGNLYLFDLSSGSVVSIWRRLGGVWSQLASAPYSSAIGSWYELRFEANGSQLRGYVDGQLVVSAQDSSFAWGLAGLHTGDAQARYDWFRIQGSVAAVTATPTPKPGIEQYPDLDALYIERTPRYAWNAEKNWPDVGEAVAFTVHIANKGKVAAGAFSVRWETLTPNGAVVPGSVVTQNVAGLAAQQQMLLRYEQGGVGKAWGDGLWRDGPYRVHAVVDAGNSVGEGPFEANNDLADYTNALTIAFKVEQDVYDAFNARRLVSLPIFPMATARMRTSTGGVVPAERHLIALVPSPGKTGRSDR